MNELFTDGVIDIEVLKEHLGDDFYNDPETKQQPTKMFEHVNDPATLLKNYVSAQRTISKGEADFAERTKGMVTIPGDDTSEDDIKAYRKAIGVPDSADGYEMAIPDGDDKESFTGIAAAVKEAALAAGASVNLVSTIWGKVVETMQAQFKAIEDKGQALMKTEQDAMKAEHKEKYDTFIKDTDEVMTRVKAGKDLKALLDTYGIGNSPAIRNFMAEIVPLVNEGETVFSQSQTENKDDGFPSYEYDDQGKPIDK